MGQALVCTAVALLLPAVCVPEVVGGKSASQMTETEVESLLERLEEPDRGRPEVVRELHKKFRRLPGTAGGKALARSIEPVLDRLARLPVDEARSEVLDGAAEIFILSGAPSPQALAFAKNLIGRGPTKALPNPWPYGLRVAQALGLQDEGLKAAVLSHLDAMSPDSISASLGYLGQHFPDDLECIEHAAKLLEAAADAAGGLGPPCQPRGRNARCW